MKVASKEAAPLDLVLYGALVLGLVSGCGCGPGFLVSDCGSGSGLAIPVDSSRFIN